MAFSVTIILTTPVTDADNFLIYHSSITPSNLMYSNITKEELVSGFVISGIPSGVTELFLVSGNECNNFITIVVSEPPTPTLTATATATPTPTPDLLTVFGLLADSGEPNPTSLDFTSRVANGVKSFNPNFVIHMGDANYWSGDPNTLYDNFLTFWDTWLDKMYFAFGNHDLDTDYGSAILDNLPLVNNAIGSTKRTNKLLCYDFVQGPVHFFVLNSGNSASGDSMNETIDPNIQLAAQMAEMTPKITGSTATWKIVVVHRPPYTNGDNHDPGSPALRFDYASLGVDIVLSAHSHAYEYIVVNQMSYFVQGLGGATKHNLISPLLNGTEIAYNIKHAYTICTASSTQLIFRTYTIDDELIDIRVFNSITPTPTLTATPTPTPTIDPCENCVTHDVTIGSQIWTGCNLDVTTYRNGNVIPQVTNPTQWGNLTTGAWCYYNNDPANGATYGKLYNIYAILDPRGIAPVGYHVPDNAEWTTLTATLGGGTWIDTWGDGSSYYQLGIGESLKEANDCHWDMDLSNPTNISGFTALPAGDVSTSGYFIGLQSETIFAGRTLTNNIPGSLQTWGHSLSSLNGVINRGWISPNQGISVRLIKD